MHINSEDKRNTTFKQGPLFGEMTDNATNGGFTNPNKIPLAKHIMNIQW